MVFVEWLNGQAIEIEAIVAASRDHKCGERG